MSYFTNYYIKNQEGNVEWLNANIACFAELINNLRLVNIDGTLEVIFPVDELRIKDHKKTIPKFVEFVSQRFCKCTAALVEKPQLVIPPEQDHLNRSTRLSKPCWIFTIPLKRHEQVAADDLRAILFFKKLKLALHLIRYLYESNLHYIATHFLELQKKKKQIKSQVDDITLLNYVISELPRFKDDCRFWGGHGAGRHFNYYFTFDDNYLNDVDWRSVCESLSGPFCNHKSILPTSAKYDDFLNFSKYLK